MTHPSDSRPTRGIVAAGSQLTAEAGTAMLRQGGNAVDAAVAAAFATFAAEPSLSTPGGAGYATVLHPEHGALVYDFGSTAPGLGADHAARLASPALDFHELQIDYGSSIDTYYAGRASSAVPGILAGLGALLDDLGTLPLATVIAPAVRILREGFILSPVRALVMSLEAPMLQHTPGIRAIYAPDGHLLRAGDRYRNPALAATLEQLAAEGVASFYTGALAEQLAADHAAHGGLISADDLAAYRVIKRPALALHYRDYTVYTNPPPSAGGILIAFALKLLEHARLGDTVGTLTHNDLDHVRLLAEVMRATAHARFRDRPADLPDPATWAAWLDGPALATGWDAVQRALVDGPPPPAPDLDGGPSSTTHLSAQDAHGIAVSLTTTPGETGGYIIDATGLVMNNMLGEIDLNPDGFFKHAPGARLPSMMAPTILADATGPRLVTGSGGANRLRSVILQAISNAVDWHLPVHELVTLPRVHVEDGTLHLEGGIDAAIEAALRARGYALRTWTPHNFYFGGAHTILAYPNGRLTGAGDPRRDGAVAVVE